MFQEVKRTCTALIHFKDLVLRMSRGKGNNPYGSTLPWQCAVFCQEGGEAQKFMQSLKCQGLMGTKQPE